MAEHPSPEDQELMADMFAGFQTVFDTFLVKERAGVAQEMLKLTPPSKDDQAADQLFWDQISDAGKSLIALRTINNYIDEMQKMIKSLPAPVPGEDF